MNATQRRVLLYFFRAYWKAYTALAAFAILLAALEGLQLAVLYPLMGDLLGAPPTVPGRLGRAVDALLSSLHFRDRLVAACVLLLVLTPVKGALGLLFERAVAWVSGRFLYRIKKKIIDEYARAPYQFFADHRLGELQFFALTAPTRAALILTRIPQGLVEALRAAAILGLLATISVRATLALLALGFAAQVLIGWLTHRASYRLGTARVESGTRMNSLFNELIVGIKQIRAFGSQSWWMGRLDEASRKYSEIFVRDASLMALPRTILETLVLTGLAAALLTARLKRPDEMRALLPLAGTFAAALMKLLPSISSLSRMRIEISGALPDLEGIHRSLMVELKRPHEPPRRRFTRLERGISLKGVRFDYPGRADVLRGVDIEIAAGTTAALVGDSGSGKTTLLNILLGLYQPSGGDILIDGVPLAELEPDDWRARIGLVSQDTFVFNGTVAENILFGRKFPGEALDHAARQAHADGFISELPGRYDAVVGERGLKLSGGQQQRLAIARAVIGTPEILLFDEATSALDSISEAAVQDAIAEASKGRTVVQIAHRLSTIENADRIYVLHEGRVAESGTHTELVRLGGRYAAFHERQAGRTMS